MPRLRARNSVNATAKPALNPKTKNAVTHGISSKRKVRNGRGGKGIFRRIRARSMVDAERRATPETHRLSLSSIPIRCRWAGILK
ncbi:hypothetical protein DRO64_10875 [Candidatus Bathyarchaeota archaeon]|nr:MAG: hypothetical protein DRO64_10875 [Candidatus Bathyarchaeota archaeon]